MRPNTRQHEARTPRKIASLIINSTKPSLRSLAHIRIDLQDCIYRGNVFVEQRLFQWLICEDVVRVDHWWRARKRCEPRVTYDLYTAHCCLQAHHYSQRVMAVKSRIRLGDVDEHPQAEEWGDPRDLLRSVGISVSHSYYLHLDQTIQPVLSIFVPIQRQGIHE